MKIRTIILATLWSLVALNTFAKVVDDSSEEKAMAKVKAYSIFLYQFSRYVEWPEARNEDAFVIGVYGTSDVTPALKTLAATKKINGHSIVVEQIDHSSDIAKCHVLFVPKSKGLDINALSQKARNNHVLLVTEEMKDAMKEGAVINFVEVNSRMNFELSMTEANNYDLQVSAALKQLATTVK